MSKALQLKIERIKKQLAQHEQRLKNLDKDYDALFEQLIFESNAADKNNKERQLESIDKERRGIWERYAELEAELQEIEASGIPISLTSTTPAVNPRIQKLLDLLLPYEQQILEFAGEGFVVCRSEGWNHPQPETLKGLMLALEEMLPDHNGRSPLVKFVAFLTLRLQTPQTLSQLVAWGKEQLPDFATLQAQMKQQLTVQRTKQARSYLLILVDQSKVNPKEYAVKAHIVPDEQAYNPVLGEGFDVLNHVITDRETFQLKDLAVLAQGYLEQCSQYPLQQLTVEVFLPLPLLNEAVDIWERQEYGIPVRIGCDYSVVVRSIERLKDYGHLSEWQDKWETLRAKMNNHACDLFIDGNCDLGTLLFKLGEPEVIALKLAKIPEQVRVESIFAALLKTATPLALWVRRNLPILPYQMSEFNSLLGCCIQELPNRVKLKRRETLLPDNQQEDNHIGHHLALIWEDPHRLPPPDIEYLHPGL